MDALAFIMFGALCGVAGLVIYNNRHRRVIIFEHEKGILFRKGELTRVLDSGSYKIHSKLDHVERVDLRIKVMTIPGQEVLTSDRIPVKTSLVVQYRITDPKLFIMAAESCSDLIYTTLQNAIRQAINTTNTEDVLTSRVKLEDMVHSSSHQELAKLGVEILKANIRDISVPADIKKVLSQVVKAQQESRAGLEKARTEIATLRALTNAAKLLEENPMLLQLRLLQAVEQSTGNTVVIGQQNKP